MEVKRAAKKSASAKSKAKTAKKAAAKTTRSRNPASPMMLSNSKRAAKVEENLGGSEPLSVFLSTAGWS